MAIWFFNRRATRRIQTFIPWYAAPESMAALAETYGGNGPANCLTHLAFQGYNPAAGGASVEYTTSDDTYPTAANVQTARAWAQALGIKVLLCVHNQSELGVWDWPLAKSAFDTNKASFIASLVSRMNADGLDGIDIDFEAFDVDYPEYEFEDDKAAFLSFLTDLKAAMGADKFLVVNCVAYIWNAVPIALWGADIAPLVDGINSMGYNETGINAEGWASYEEQKRVIGGYAHKFCMGMYTSLGTWQGDVAQDQVDWFVAQDEIGLSLWDAQISHASWQTSAIWASIKNIHDDVTIP